MRSVAALLCLGLATTACTYNSDSVQPMAVSPTAFSGQSCSSLSDQLTAEKDKLADLSQMQDDGILADVRVMGASLGSVPEGGATNHQSSIAYSKGKVNAIDIAMRKNGCPM